MHQDNEFSDAVMMRTQLKERAKELAEDIKYYEAIIKSKMGPAAIATTDEFYVTYKTAEYEAYSVPASSRRSLRVRPLKGGK
jgi:hypothetical protein